MSLYKKRSAPIRIALSVMTLSGLVLTAQAQGTSAAALSGSVSLKDVFETAWQRQPEAYALQSRRDAAQAQAKAASMLSPEPPSLEISQRSDRMTGNSGAREAEVGIAFPSGYPDNAQPVPIWRKLKSRWLSASCSPHNCGSLLPSGMLGGAGCELA